MQLLVVAVAAALAALAAAPQPCRGHAGHDHDAVVEPIFKQLEVVPDVLDAAPQRELIITYPNDVTVSPGDELRPVQVKDTPTVQWTHADPAAFYTLILTDPDAPSRAQPTSREWQHWTVVNIPGEAVASGNASAAAGQQLAEYVGAGPPQGTGQHRYVFALFRQQHGAHDFGEPLLRRTNGNRARFSTRAFAQKHALGAPVAGNVFVAEYDDYVPTLHAQFE